MRIKNRESKKALGDSHLMAHAIPDDSMGGANSRFFDAQEVHVDARGFTYCSVRFCDLERFSDK